MMAMTLLCHTIAVQIQIYGYIRFNFSKAISVFFRPL